MEADKMVKPEVREAGQVVIDFDFPAWLPNELRDKILERVRSEIEDCVTGAVMDVYLSHGPKWDTRTGEVNTKTRGLEWMGEALNSNDGVYRP